MNDERGVSPVFAYVLTLAIAAILTGGLIMTAGTYVSDQRERTGESELQVLGQQISADVAAADRLARTGDSTEVRVQRSLPSDVIGSEYQVSLRTDTNGPTEPYLELQMTDLDVVVRVGLSVKMDIAESTVEGGDIVVEYDESSNELVLRNE